MTVHTQSHWEDAQHPMFYCLHPFSCPLIRGVTFTTSTWGGEDTLMDWGTFSWTVLSPWKVRYCIHGYLDMLKQNKTKNRWKTQLPSAALQLSSQLSCICSIIIQSQKQDRIWHRCHFCSQNAIHLCTNVFWWDCWIWLNLEKNKDSIARTNSVRLHFACDNSSLCITTHNLPTTSNLP